LKKKSPTVLDVARSANVSVGTVSNVLNGSIRVSDARRERVLNAIAQLGYKKNLLAQGLRRRRSPIIGLCVPFTTISYFAALVDAFEEVASDRDFELMQALSGLDPAIELQRVNALLRYHIGGLMILPGVKPELVLDVVAQSGTPTVIIDRPVADRRFDQVTFDNRAAMLEATERLIALGHRRILFVVRQKQLSVTKRRIAALKDAARKASEDVSISVVECGYDESSYRPVLKSAFEEAEPPTALIVSNSVLAAWTVRGFNEIGIRCPDDASLIAFDEPEWADLVRPSLSTIRQPTRMIAITAWETLMRRMRGEGGEGQRIVLKADVLFRESVGPAPRRRNLRLATTRGAA
jgi:LacI family transcriptional regulator